MAPLQNNISQVINMDLPVDKHHLDKSKKNKAKPKTKHKKHGARAFFKDIKHSAKEWWKSSNHASSPATQPNVDVSIEFLTSQQLEKQIAQLSFEDSLVTSSLTSESHGISLGTTPQESALDNKTDLLRKRLFLIEEKYPDLYRDVNERLAKFKMDMTTYEYAQIENPNIQKPKVVHRPVTQLSHDGLALMSHLYAKKDGSAKQPIVVKTFKGFEKIVTFVDNSLNDVSVTLIIQFDKGIVPFLEKDIHRVAMRLEKINSEIHAICLDSVATSRTLAISTLKLNQFVIKNALKNSKEKTTLHIHLSQFENELDRQNDKFQCSVFSAKDARELNRDNNLILDLKKSITFSKEDSQHYYNIPPKYLKGLQSQTNQTLVSTKFGDEVVTRKGLTLKEVYLKHPDQSYIPHFSKKFEMLVMQCTASLTDAELNTVISNYRAEEITAERLNLVYGNKPVLRK